MSDINNERLFEHWVERFDEVKDGFGRLAILEQIRQEGNAKLLYDLEESWYQERYQFLADNNVEEKDILFDKDTGLEYYLDIFESGGGDDYQTQQKAVVLPFYLNVEHWLPVRSAVRVEIKK